MNLAGGLMEPMAEPGEREGSVSPPEGSIAFHRLVKFARVGEAHRCGGLGCCLSHFSPVNETDEQLAARSRPVQPMAQACPWPSGLGPVGAGTGSCTGLPLAGGGLGRA